MQRVSVPGMAIRHKSADFQFSSFVHEQLNNGRTTGGVLMKYVSIHAATLIAYGHFNSIRLQPETVQYRNFLALILLPTYPAAELVINLYRTFRRWRTLDAPTSWPYLLACVLGSHATLHRVEPTDEDRNMPVICMDPSPWLLRRKSQPYTLQWLGRLAVLLCFLIQDLAIVVNYYRRPRGTALIAELSQAARDAGWRQELVVTSDLDTANAVCALGALFSGLGSLVLVASNWAWTYSPLGLPDQQRERTRDLTWRSLLPLQGPPACWAEFTLAGMILFGASAFSAQADVVAVLYLLSGLDEHLSPDEDRVASRSIYTTVLAVPAVVVVGALLSTIVRCVCPSRKKALAFIQWHVAMYIIVTYIAMRAVGQAIDLASIAVCRLNKERLLALGEDDLSPRTLGWCNPWLLWDDPHEKQLWSL
jgi:hypothetical protein